MLIEFRVENYRSIRDEQVLTLEAGRVGSSDDPRPRHVPGSTKKILPVAAIYGANASGKSNVLAAIVSMREAVLLSLRHWSPDEGIPQDPFAWGVKSTEATSFEVQMVIEGTRYRYGFKFNDKVFLEEWLYAWPKGKQQTWLERVGGSYTFGENLRGENKVIEEVTRPNALFLSAAAQLKHPQLSPIYTWFSSLAKINLKPREGNSQYSFLTALVSEDEIAILIKESSQMRLLPHLNPALSMANRFKALLNNADVGIVDVRVASREQASKSRARHIEVKHQNKTGDAWLPLEEESKGTQTLIRLALPVLHAIDGGRVLVVDELESSMHPNLAELIVSQFNDPGVNTRNAQLIFSTHDTNLLGTLSGEPVLRRDQIWLTEKDDDGASVLYPLTDFKPRKEENVERGYIQGRYGAIPYLGNFRIPPVENP